MPDVYCAPSIWRDIDVRTMTSIMAAIHNNPTPGERVVWEPLWNDALIARSRSVLATKFIEDHPECDVMVIIDSDVVFEPDDFWKIVEGARETRSIYGGVYVTRSTKPHVASRFLPNTRIDIAYSPQRRPVELEYLATGFWAMHRDVLLAMIDGEFKDADGTHKMHYARHGAGQPFWPFFATFTIEERPDLFHYLSEDWAICERARQLGFKIWMDQSIILAHMGWYPFTVADMSRGDTDPGLPSTGTDYVEVEAAGPRWDDPILDSLVEDIAEFAEENIGDVRRMVATGSQVTGRLWQERPEGETDAEWYTREDVGMAYIGDLADWHHRGAGQWHRLIEFDGKRILDYGAGIGTAALAASRDGAMVEVYEPNPTMREFMTFRAGKHGISLSLVNGPEGLYDAIACWHVFEHLPDPEATLERLLGHLAPGGVFLTESGFQDRTTPQHREHPDWFGALERHGLREVSQGVYERVAVLVQ